MLSIGTTKQSRLLMRGMRLLHLQKKVRNDCVPFVKKLNPTPFLPLLFEREGDGG
jgi:hypothetical protein